MHPGRHKATTCGTEDHPRREAGTHTKFERVQILSAELQEALNDMSAVMSDLSAAIPGLENMSRHVRKILDANPDGEELVLAVPVFMLRFTHYTINAEMSFGDDHENRQESIFKLFDTLFVHSRRGFPGPAFV